MEEFVCNEVAGFQDSILLKVNFSTCIFQDFVQVLFRYTCFRERIFMAASGIYLFNLFLLSCKRESKTVALLRMSPNVFLETSKVFVWPHLHHCDITHDQAYKLAVHKKLQSFQFNAFLAVTGIIRGISREKLHQELGLE